jgi:eukaryotic-like serine/threonine-protein kinase
MEGTVIGNYRIVEKLGEGGMGAVYKAVDVNLDSPVALKALNVELGRDPELEQRFRAEIKALGHLHHTNLVALQGLLIEQGRPWMVMEFVEGETFEQMVRRRGPIPADEAIPLFHQALAGVAYGHRMGVIHRDLKPANIIVNQEGVVKVMDFGMAKILSTRGLAKSGTRVGTPAYMSPEQFLNRPVDARSDVYSLGVTLYEMLTGKVPFSADNDFQIMSDHVNTPAPPPTQFFAYVPKSAEQAVLKALDKSPDARYQTAEEFAQALDGAVPVAAGRKSGVPVAAARAAGTGVALGARLQPIRAALARFLNTRERKMLAAALAVFLVLAGVLAAMRIKAGRAAAAAAAQAAQANAAAIAQAQNAANAANANPGAPAQPDATGNPQAPADAGAAPADQGQPGVAAGGVAVVPGAPAAGVAVVPGAPAVGVAVAPAQPAAPDDSGAAAPSVIPAGTMIAVRTVDAVTSAGDTVGQTFDATVDADIVVGGNVLVPSGSDAGLVLRNVAQVPAAKQSDVQLELVRLNVNGMDYGTHSSIFEQQSLPRTKKSVAVAGARAAFGALGGVLSHGSAGQGAAAGAASTYVVSIAPQTRIEFKLRRKVVLAQ